MALDGKSFFYVNPLEVLPEACHKDERKFHVKPVRQKWFGCACCPPNIARLLSSISTYAYTENKDTLFVHLYIGGIIKKQLDGQEIEIKVTSEFPWDGTVKVEMPATEKPFTLAFRIPQWAKNYQVKGIERRQNRRKSRLSLCDKTVDWNGNSRSGIPNGSKTGSDESKGKGKYWKNRSCKGTDCVLSGRSR